MQKTNMKHFFRHPLTIHFLFFLVVIKAHAGGDESVKLFKAQQEFFKGNVQGAYNIYKDLSKRDSANAYLAYKVGECAFDLHQYEVAMNYLEKAKTLNFQAESTLFLLLGKAYHVNGQFDKAIAEFNTYKNKETSPKKIAESKADLFIAQCNTAKELVAKPVEVFLRNLSGAINSVYDDKTPTLLPDGKSIIFNTRRPAGKSSIPDIEADGKFTDDIYITTWDEENKEWNPAEPIPGFINTEAYEACTGVSQSGKELFIYKNEEFVTKSGDIFISKLNPSGKWLEPKPIGGKINTAYYEDGACLSPDGNTLYFISERKGGLGKSDIYMAQRISEDEWEAPVNLGEEVNTPEDEAGPFMASDGKTLFFCSQGHNSMGGYDIFKTVYENGKWSKPVNLGYPINSERRDGPITFSSDGSLAYLSSDRAAGVGATDIYEVYLSNVSFFKAPEKKKAQSTSLITLKGMIIDLEAGQAIETELIIMDEVGQRVSAISSNNDGEYSVSLPGEKKYELKIENKQYKPLKEKVYLAVDSEGNPTVVKNISLSRK